MTARRPGPAGGFSLWPAPATAVSAVPAPARNGPVIGALIAVADDVGATPGQVALAWVTAKGVILALGPRPRTRAQLGENLGAATLALDDESLRRLDQGSAVPPRASDASAARRRSFMRAYQRFRRARVVRAHVRDHVVLRVEERLSADRARQPA